VMMVMRMVVTVARRLVATAVNCLLCQQLQQLGGVVNRNQT